MADSAITLDDLITALGEQREYENAHEDLRRYFDQRLSLLCEFFGCDFEAREKELDTLKRASDRERGRRDQDGSSTDIEARYEISGRLTMSFLAQCLTRMNQSLLPGGIFMEGMPPRIQRDLMKQYSPAIRDQEREMKRVYRMMVRDLLEYLFPGVSAKNFPARRLYEMGLPREKPDVNDYF